MCVNDYFTFTHAHKKQSLSVPITGHAFLDKPGHLCTKQVRCAGAMSTPGARARSSQEVPTMPPTAGVGTLCPTTTISGQ